MQSAPHKLPARTLSTKKNEEKGYVQTVEINTKAQITRDGYPKGYQIVLGKTKCSYQRV